MKKIKILYMVTKGNFGGAQRYVFDMAKNLPRDKFTVKVVCGEGKTLQEKLAEERIPVIEISILARDINIFRDMVAFLEILKIIGKEKPDVIHLNSSKMGGIGALAARFANMYHFLNKSPHRIKIIFTGHGWAFNEKRNIISKILIGFTHWLTIMLVDSVVAVSNQTKKDISILPFTSGKIIVIRNGIGEINFLERDEARKRLASQVPEKNWIGTISELHESNKGQDFLIRAFSEIADKRDVACLIIGEGNGRRQFEKLIKKFGLEEKVHLLGFKKDAAKYLKAFDIFTLTSRVENLPYGILEAGLAELPTIASSVGGIPEIIENNKSGILCKIGNIDEIREALQNLLEDSYKRYELGKNLRENIQTNFDVRKMVTETLHLYK